MCCGVYVRHFADTDNEDAGAVLSCEAIYA
jgi:hypothetical protein